ncbi:hypothetical protein ACPVTF_02245 [Geobacillus icigianus]|uniref:Uncharacterized protein n=2 Tax=Geobacillus TaxID=129337 RepID=A0A679FU04_9BACL|nr:MULTISPECIES: hypothetical protein [Geobacillus]MEB3752719.1 hypothetical protein [Geobacillus icigianus]BBW98459.1 hypothetical protein GsuE55_32920 [Geobacillus subterraneus]
MKFLLDIVFLIGALGTIGRYVGIEFFKENSTLFLILFVAGGFGRLVFSMKEQKNSDEVKSQK